MQGLCGSWGQCPPFPVSSIVVTDDPRMVAQTCFPLLVSAPLRAVEWLPLRQGQGGPGVTQGHLKGTAGLYMCFRASVAHSGHDLCPLMHCRSTWVSTKTVKSEPCPGAYQLGSQAAGTGLSRHSCSHVPHLTSVSGPRVHMDGKADRGLLTHEPRAPNCSLSGPYSQSSSALPFMVPAPRAG